MKKLFVFCISTYVIYLPSLLHAQGQPDNSSSLTRLGIMKIRGGYYDEAIKLLDKAISMDKENTLAYYQRGKAEAGLANYEEAIKDFGKVIELEPTYAPAYIDRGNAQKRLGNEAASKANFDKAAELDNSYKESGEIKVAKKTNKFAGTEKPIDSENPAVITEEKPAQVVKPPQKEKDVFDYMLEMLPADEVTAEKYLQRANAKCAIAKYKEAIEDYDKALALSPNYVEAYVGRAYARSVPFDTFDWKGALKDCDKALTINSNYPDAYIRRSYIKNVRSDFKGAINDCTKALKINPKLADAYIERGRAERNLNDCKSAIADWEKAIKLNRACKIWVLPLINEARVKLNGKAVEDMIDQAKKYNELANRKFSKGDNDGAIEEFEKAIRIDQYSEDPNYANAFSNRGVLKYHRGDYIGAIKDIDKAVSINPGSYNFYEMRGKAKIGLGDYKGALEDLEKAAGLFPNEQYQSQLQQYIDYARANMK